MRVTHYTSHLQSITTHSNNSEEDEREKVREMVRMIDGVSTIEWRFHP